MPQTISEKIIAAHAAEGAVSAGEIATVTLDVLMLNDVSGPRLRSACLRSVRGYGRGSSGSARSRRAGGRRSRSTARLRPFLPVAG